MATNPQNLVGKTLLGRYAVEAPLGSGGMGAVFVATQLSLGRKIALKVMKSVDAGDEAVKRFQRETEVVARLQHPHIVQVVDAGQAEDGTLFLAMELLPGENLRMLLRREGAQPFRRVLAFAEDIASALVAAHGEGVIHRDLKLENVMVAQPPGRHEICKVLDFGVAKLTSAASAASTVTGSGFVAGTPGSIAPEQMSGIADDPRSDLYALGVMMFELLAGRPPFTGTTSMELLLRHMKEPAPRLRELARGLIEIPEQVDALVDQLLAKDPAHRPASAQELVTTLRALRDNFGASATPRPLPTPSVAIAGAVPHELVRALPSTPGGPVPTSVIDLPPDDPTGDDDVLPAAKLAQPDAAGTRPTPHAGAVPTVAPSVARAPLSRRMTKKRLLIALSITVLLGVAGFIAFAINLSHQLASTPRALENLDAAMHDTLNLDFGIARKRLETVLTEDPNSAAALLVLSAIDKLEGAPLARIDRSVAAAASVARPSYIAFFPSHVKDSVEILAEFDPERALQLFKAHQSHTCDAIEMQLMAIKLLFAVDPHEIIPLLLAVPDHDSEGDELRPLTLMTLAQAHALAGEADKALAYLDQLPPAKRALPLVRHVEIDILLSIGRNEDAMRLLHALVDQGDAHAAVRLVREGQDDDESVARALELIGRIQDYSTRSAQTALLGYALAGRARLTRADEVWKKAIEPLDPAADLAVIHEVTTTAAMFAIMGGRYDLVDEWLQRVDDDFQLLGTNDRSTARIRALSLGTRVLAAIHMGTLEKKEALLFAFRKEPIDVPLLVHAVSWKVKLAHNDYDGALKDVVTPGCINDHGRAMIRLSRAAKSGDVDDPRDARQDLQQMLAAGMHYCFHGDSLLSDIGTQMYTDGLVTAAEAEARLKHPAEARALLERAQRELPHSDVNSGWRCHARAIARCLDDKQSSCVITGSAELRWPFCE